MERSDLSRRHSAVRQNLIIQHLHMQENGLGRWDIITDGAELSGG